MLHFPENECDLEDLEAVLDVLRVDLRDEEEVAHVPCVQRRVGAGDGPVSWWSGFLTRF